MISGKAIVFGCSIRSDNNSARPNDRSTTQLVPFHQLTAPPYYMSTVLPQFYNSIVLVNSWVWLKN